MISGSQHGAQGGRDWNLRIVYCAAMACQVLAKLSFGEHWYPVAIQHIDRN